MGLENKEVGKDDANLLLPNFCAASRVTQLSVFKVVYHEHPFAFSPATLVMP